MSKKGLGSKEWAKHLRKSGKRDAAKRLRNEHQRAAWELGHKVVESKVKYNRKRRSPDEEDPG